MEKRAAAALVITLVLAGCASSTQPSVMVYPTKGQSARKGTNGRMAPACRAGATR